MWASRYFNPRYWAERFWAKVGAVSVQTQEVVTWTDGTLSGAYLATEVVTWSELDAQAVTYAALKTESVG